MLKINPIKQSNSYYCGPASLKMVLDYYGIKKSQKEVARLTNTTSKTGCSKDALVDAVQKLDLKVKVIDSASLLDLKKHIKKNIPVVVDWYSDKFEGHYSVVVGFSKSNIYIADSYYGKIRKMKSMDFYDRWFDFIGPPSKKGLVLRRMIIVEKKKLSPKGLF